MSYEEVKAYVGRWIVNHRQEKGMTQEQLADAVRITMRSMKDYEDGRQSIPITVLYRIAYTLEREMADFLPKAPFLKPSKK